MTLQTDDKCIQTLSAAAILAWVGLNNYSDNKSMKYRESLSSKILYGKLVRKYKRKGGKKQCGKTIAILVM